MDDLFFMNMAYMQACKAFDNDEVPIGAVLVDKSGKVVSKAYNQIEKKQTQLAHAEMQVLLKASKKMNSWRLSNLVLYVTVQPCLMCLGALYLSRISRVVYGISSPKFGASINVFEQGDAIYKHLEMKIECFEYQKSKELLKLFFEKKRSLLSDE